MKTTNLRSDYFQSNPVPSFVYEPIGQRIIQANHAAIARYGYSPREFRTMSLNDLRPTGPQRPELALYNPSASSHTRVTHATKAGQCFVVELHVASWHHAGHESCLLSAVDVSDWNESQLTILRSDDIHRSQIDKCPLGVFRVNVKTARIEEANSALLQILDYTLEQLRSICVTSLYANPSDRLRFLSKVYQAGRVRDFETHFRTRCGTLVRVSLSGYLCSDDETGEQFVHGYALDITHQHELEEQLNHSHRMEAVGRLAGGVAHDFNNITQAISLSCELALQQPLSPPLQSKLLDIMRQTSRAAEITRQLLAFSRRQVLQPRVVNLNDCVRQALSMIARTVGVDVSIELKLDETTDHVFIDPEQLTLVIMHLADNARQAMSQGGVLRISTANAPAAGSEALSHSASATGSLALPDLAPAAGSLALSPAPAAGSEALSPAVPDPTAAAPYAVLTIADTGIGMDENTLHHIFEPFFSTRETALTSGLGLSTVHGIIAQSKGRIQCSSGPGQGTTFRICLPLAHAPAVPQAKPQNVSEPVGLLLAEDDPIVRKHLAHALKQFGFSVDSACNGEEALAAFDPLKHQLLITDIIMPKVGGVELTSRLRQRFPDLPVLLISGYSEEISVLQHLPGERIAYLQKPFPVTALVNSIQSLFAECRPPQQELSGEEPGPSRPSHSSPQVHNLAKWSP